MVYIHLVLYKEFTVWELHHLVLFARPSDILHLLEQV